MWEFWEHIDTLLPKYFIILFAFYLPSEIICCKEKEESRCVHICRKGRCLLIVKALNGADISTNNGNLGGSVHPLCQKRLFIHDHAFLRYLWPVPLNLLAIQESLIFKVIHTTNMVRTPFSIHLLIASNSSIIR